MTVAILALMIALFALMGVGAILRPATVTAQFGISSLARDGRNEVRAVYGGFGLSIALALGLALRVPELRSGICLTVGLALLGMAFGRIVSALMDRGLGRFPLLYLVSELVGAGLLLLLVDF